MQKIELRPFIPAPWAPNGHLQTYFALVGNPLGGQIPHKVEFLELSDGDQVVLRVSEPTGNNKAVGKKDLPVCVLFHGLGGDSESPYMLRIAHKLNVHGFPVVRFNHRGCAEEGRDKARHIYHAGRIEDIDETLAWVSHKFSGRQILAVGFSLSANMLLLFLGKLLGAQNHPMLRASLAVNPPIDLFACSLALEQRQNFLIDRFFTVNLLKAARQRAEILNRCGWTQHTPDTLSKVDSLRSFDTYFTAPLAGFSSCHEYYQQCSSKPWLGRICRPTKILSAADDPIIPGHIFNHVALSSQTVLDQQPRGGHLGYLSKTKTHHLDRRWLDDYVVHWAQEATV